MSLKKSLKKLAKKAKKALQSAGQVAIKAVKYGAPIVGTLVGGPVGGAAGTALAGLAATHRAKNKGAAFLRTAKYGATITGGAALLGGISGAGFGSTLLNTGSRLFGGGAPAQPTAPADPLEGADFNPFSSTKTPGAGDSVLGSLGDAFTGQSSSVVPSLDGPPGSLPDGEPIRPEDAQYQGAAAGGGMGGAGPLIVLGILGAMAFAGKK